MSLPSSPPPSLSPFRRSLLSLALLVVVGGLFLYRLSHRITSRLPQAEPAAAGSGAAASRSVAPGGKAQKPSSDGGKAPPGARLAAGTEILKAAWGSRAGELGRRHEAESNVEGPMAMLGGADEALILDQVNRRVERFERGQRVASVPLGSDTAQDLAIGPDGRTVVLDRLVEKNVQVYDRDGKLRNEIPLDEKAVGETGSITGVFADRDGIYVERDHGKVVRIADPSGLRDRPPEELAGRPSRDGQLLISAAITDRAAGQLAVTAVRRQDGQTAFSQGMTLGAPILHIVMLDSDRQGRVYLAAATGREGSEPPYPILDEAIEAVQLGSGGALRGRLVVPPLVGAEESLRPLSVDDSGALLVMRTLPEGAVVTRYVFP